MTSDVASVVLLHGFTGSPASYDAVVAGLPATVVCARPALFGHGEDDSATSFEGEVARLGALAEKLPAPRLLVGYSLGGRIALGMLLARPTSFARAILVGAHPGLDGREERAARRVHDVGWAARLRNEGLASFVEAWDAQALFASQANAPLEARNRQRAIRLAHDPEKLARSLETLGLAEMPSYGERLPALRVPVTLVVGALDAKLVAIARAMHACLPSSELVEVPGVGHNVLLEAPEILVAKIREAIGGER